jgi:hypothetical protein
MVMEVLDGPTRKTALKEVHRRHEEMPLRVALRVVSDVGAAVAYASGDAGVIAGTFEEGGVDIPFDDSLVHQP